VKAVATQVNKMQAIVITEQFATRIREFLPESRVYLFGSRAKGTERRDSDIDVGVLIEKMPEITKYRHLKDRFCDIAFKMEEELKWMISDETPVIDIEPHLVTMEDRTGFARTIYKTGIEVANPDLLESA
jgi:predicted nucleotidyltransferase